METKNEVEEKEIKFSEYKSVDELHVTDEVKNVIKKIRQLDIDAAHFLYSFSYDSETDTYSAMIDRDIRCMLTITKVKDQCCHELVLTHEFIALNDSISDILLSKQENIKKDLLIKLYKILFKYSKKYNTKKMVTVSFPYFSRI